MQSDAPGCGAAGAAASRQRAIARQARRSHPATQAATSSADLPAPAIHLSPVTPAARWTRKQLHAQLSTSGDQTREGVFGPGRGATTGVRGLGQRPWIGPTFTRPWPSTWDSPTESILFSALLHQWPLVAIVSVLERAGTGDRSTHAARALTILEDGSRRQSPLSVHCSSRVQLHCVRAPLSLRVL